MLLDNIYIDYLYNLIFIQLEINLKLKIVSASRVKEAYKYGHKIKDLVIISYLKKYYDIEIKLHDYNNDEFDLYDYWNIKDISNNIEIIKDKVSKLKPIIIVQYINTKKINTIEESSFTSNNKLLFIEVIPLNTDPFTEYKNKLII